MTEIMIAGINGRMGREVYLEAAARRTVNVACGVDRHAMGNFDCPVFCSPADADCHVDVIVDFSSPSLLGGLIKAAEERGCAAVFATTGYDAGQIENIKALAKKVPVCLAANFSAGISAVKEILPILAERLKGFDAAVVETHGKAKKDAPSGTAKDLSRILGGAEIFSVRGGNAAGEHIVKFMGEYETVEIRHTALSRRVFAKGAVDMCELLPSLPAGLYDERGKLTIY